MDAQRALKVISRDGNAFLMDENALSKILKDPQYADKNILLISVAGSYRKGKSFLLNFFLQYLTWREKGDLNSDWLLDGEKIEGFDSRGGTNRVTEGILIWPKPFLVKNAINEEVVVLLMDTQGIFDSKSSLKDCSTIFALSTLLSSVQIFNISQIIGTDHLEYLHMFTEYGELVANENQKPFQDLLFLIRDWSSPDEFGYGFDGGKEYLESFFSSKESNKTASELHQHRQRFYSSFENIFCFLMPHPGLAIARGLACPIERIEEDFITNLKLFVPHFFNSTLAIKKINNKDVTCRELLQYFKVYVDTFKSDNLPQPQSMYEATIAANHLLAISTSKDLYTENMGRICNDDELIINSIAFDVLHDEWKEDAIKKFNGLPKMGNSEQTEKSLANLKKEMNKEYVHFAFKNNSKLRRLEQQRIIEEQRLAQDEMRQQMAEQLQQMNVQNQHIAEREQQIQNNRRREILYSIGNGVLSFATPLIGEYFRHGLALQQQQHMAQLAQAERLNIRGLDLATGVLTAVGTIGGRMILSYLSP